MNQNGKKKWALLIGINKYPNLASRCQLSGCVNDVMLMSNILQENFGFSKENITLLKDEQASQKSILGAMENLAKIICKDDIIVIHYSGHGSQMTDREDDDPDGMDETIVPSDSGRYPNENRDITDDQIYENLLKISEITPFTTLLFDCCHSGTIARDAFGVNTRWIDPDTRPITDLPPSTVNTTLAKKSSRDLGPSGWMPLGQRYVLIAGCRDEESSYEYEVLEGDKLVMHGTLTYFLGRELVKASSGTTYRDIFERISSQVTAVHSRQHPQIEGALDRELFDIHEISPMRFVPVRRRIGGEVILGAGAAHGMMVNSQWRVYSSQTKCTTEETPCLGLTEIAEVHPVTSKGKILKEVSPGVITEGTRAIEYSHFYGKMRLVVDVQAPIIYKKNIDELRVLIEQSALLRLAADNEVIDACIYIIPPREVANAEDPAPQLGAISEATWAVVGQDGKLMMPLHHVSEAVAPVDLRNNLENVIRYRQALMLYNPNEESALKGKVEFILMRRAVDGSWVEAKPTENGGQIVFEEGDRIAAEIINNFKDPIYVNVLDFGLTGAISLLYPITGANERLVAGKSIKIGIRRGDELELYFPKNFPYLPDPTDKEIAGGMETFKLFVTTHEVDFSLLVQEGYRDIGLWKPGGAGTALAQLMELALTGHGTRDARHNRVPPAEEWTTIERSFWLQHR